MCLQQDGMEIVRFFFFFFFGGGGGGHFFRIKGVLPENKW